MCGRRGWSLTPPEPLNLAVTPGGMDGLPDGEGESNREGGSLLPSGREGGSRRPSPQLCVPPESQEEMRIGFLWEEGPLHPLLASLAEGPLGLPP